MEEQENLNNDSNLNLRRELDGIQFPNVNQNQNFHVSKISISMQVEVTSLAQTYIQKE